MVIVPFLHYLVVDGMVDEEQSQFDQTVIILLSLGQKPDIDVRRLDVDTSGARRIQDGQRLGDVSHGIRIREFVSQHDHIVRDGIGRAEVPLRRVVVEDRAGAKDQGRQEKICEVFHSTSSIISFRCKVTNNYPCSQKGNV